tara:strand:+ start:247 stop:426 length:180 start_codon:yes stop_codon:yes gene_type:complete
MKQNNENQNGKLVEEVPLLASFGVPLLTQEEKDRIEKQTTQEEKDRVSEMVESITFWGF